jgi:hypothetical protein
MLTVKLSTEYVVIYWITMKEKNGMTSALDIENN